MVGSHRRNGATDAAPAVERRRLAPPPRPVPPSAWLLPAPDSADEDGVVGLGADLEPGTLVAAYREALFPWPHPSVDLPWFSPEPRGVAWPARVHVSRSLVRTLRRQEWTTTVDVAFEDVIDHCSVARGREGTWITPAMRRAYVRLHDLGWAHSIEVWDHDRRLVGGLYGVQVGGVFTGESMFHRAPDASKVAFLDVVARLAEAGGQCLDVQLTTPHLRSLGAVDMPRDEFLTMLRACRDDDVRLALEARPVARLEALAGTSR